MSARPNPAERLLKRLTKENPAASREELRKLFVEAASERERRAIFDTQWPNLYEEAKAAIKAKGRS
jgi:hypothetical protein